MNGFISGPYGYICEQAPSLRNDPEYQRAVKAYMEIEVEVQEKTGVDLLNQYQRAEWAVPHQWDFAIFRQILRFCCRFMLKALR